MNDLSRVEKRLIKVATRKLLSEFNGLEQASKHCRIAVSHLSNYQNFETTAFMPFDVVAVLQRVAGVNYMTRVLEDLDLASGIVMDLPDDIQTALLNYEKANNDAFAEVLQAIQIDSPGGENVTENEKRCIDAKFIEADRMKAALLQLINHEPKQQAAE